MGSCGGVPGGGVEPGPRNAAAFRPRREPVTPMSSFHTGKDAMRRSEGVPGAPFQEYL